MNFWRKQVIQPSLDEETQRHIDEQREWIARDPQDARPYYHLAQLYRMDGRNQEALGLLLEAVRLDPALAEAHLSLTEIYAVAGDNRAAWRHARSAESAGNTRGVDLLRRYGVSEE
jgi:cytochrome c-type biogenesis protein CcmH/NrfG